MKFRKTLAHELLSGRTKKGYTQAETAEIVRISLRWYGELENGRRIPGLICFLRLLKVLDIKISVFYDSLGLDEELIAQIDKRAEARRKQCDHNIA